MTIVACDFDASGVRMFADSRTILIDGTVLDDHAVKILRTPNILIGFGGAGGSANKRAAAIAAREFDTLCLPFIKRYVEITMSILHEGLSKDFVDARCGDGTPLFITMLASHTEVKSVTAHGDGKVEIRNHEYGMPYMCAAHIKENYLRDGGTQDARKFVQYAIENCASCGGPVQQLQI